MLGYQFYSQIEKVDDLLNGLVMPKRYVLRGSYHGNNYVFLINCQGVRWKVSLNERSSNVWTLVGDRWEHFVKQNIDDRVRFIHFIEEGEDIFYVTAYNQAGLENHGYDPTSQMVWRCLLRLSETSFQPVPLEFTSGMPDLEVKDRTEVTTDGKEYKNVYVCKNENNWCFFGPGWWTLLGELKVKKAGTVLVLTAVDIEDFNVMFFDNGGSALTAVETYATIVSKNALCHVGDEKDYDQDRMNWYCRWKFHTCHDREDRAFYLKFTTGLQRNGCIKISSDFVRRQKLCGIGYNSAVLKHKNKTYKFKVQESLSAPKGLVMLSKPSLRKLKTFAGFDNGQMLRFFLCDVTSRRDKVLRFDVC